MKRRSFLAALPAVLSTLTCARGWADGEASWKAGTARIKITPSESLWLAGYGGRNHPAEGTLHDLWVKALALEDAQGRRGVVVTADLLGIPQALYDRLCGALKEKCGLERGEVMLTCSHTHCGPVLDDALLDIYPLDDKQNSMIKRYTERLEHDLVEVVSQALADMAPATLWASEGETTYAVNRRNNHEAEVPKLRKQGIAPKGPVDHDVPVLAVRSLKGEFRAVIFGYACHATTLSFYRWCGDHPGFAQLALEKAFPGAQAMFWQGCGADQNPLPRRSVELCEQYGNMLAGAVKKTLAGSMRPLSPRLQTRFEFITLDFGSQPTLEELRKMATEGGYRGRWAGRLAKQLEAGKPFETSYRYPVQAWKLGENQLWISLGGEVVVDYALSFKKRFGPTTWTAGYTNDVMAYIPSQRVWREGGYEAGAFNVYGLPAKTWCPDIEQRITKSVAKLVKSFK